MRKNSNATLINSIPVEQGTPSDGEVLVYNSSNNTYEFGAAGASDLATILAGGNTTGGTDIVVSAGDELTLTGTFATTGTTGTLIEMSNFSGATQGTGFTTTLKIGDNFNTNSANTSRLIHITNEANAGSGDNVGLYLQNFETTITPTNVAKQGIFLNQYGIDGTILQVQGNNNVAAATNGVALFNLTNTQGSASTLTKFDTGTSTQDHFAAHFTGTRFSIGIDDADQAPGTTANKLYSLAGDLQWNGSRLTESIAQVVTVGKSGADFTTIQGAIDSITDATSSKMYRIDIAPGEYTENVVLTNYIILSGANRETTINPTSGTALTLPDTFSYVEFLKIEMAPTASGALCVDATAGGAHDMFSVILTVSSATNGITGKLLDVDCSVWVTTDSEMNYLMTGSAVGTNTHFPVDINGSTTNIFARVTYTAALGDVDDNLTMLNDTSTGVSLNDTVAFFGDATNAAYTGIFVANSAFSTSVLQRVSNSFMIITGNGSGTGYAVFVDSISNDNIGIMAGTTVAITGFTNNYYANIAAGDTFNSYFNEVNAVDGNLGAGTINQVDSLTPGDLFISGKLGVGASPLTNMVAGDILAEGGSLALKEITTPTADTNYGKIYTKTDNTLYFQDGAGTEHEVATTDSHYAEMYFYESSGTETIGQTDQYYAVSGEFSTGILDNWTFVAGSVGSGNITTAGGGAAININDTAHGLVSGDYVNVQSANHSGTSVVTYVDDDNFTVAIAYVGDEAGTWQEGDYLLAGTGAAGKYEVRVSVTASAGAAAKQFKFEAVQNATHIDRAAFAITTSGTNHQSSSSCGFITVADGDRIWLQFKNETDTQDLNYEHANVNLHRL